MANQPRKVDMFTAFTRGDDSILNTASSAERRYLEAMAIVTGVHIATLALNEDTQRKLAVDLGAIIALPAQVVGGSGGVSSAKGIFDTIPIGLQDIIVPGSTLAGRVGEAIIGGIGEVLVSKINPLVKSDGGLDKASTDQVKNLAVPVASLMQIALTVGYLMEKGLGDQIGSVLAGAGKLAEGISPEAVRVEVDTS